MITPTRSEKLEWARMAQNAYHCNLNAIGHKYSGAASIRDNQSIPVSKFDELQSGYRHWLIYGFAYSDIPNYNEQEMNGKELQ